MVIQLPEKSKHTHLIILIFGCLFVVAFHMLAYIGHYGFDDIYYARLSKQLADGVLRLDEDHFKYRWTILFFTAVSYKIFGVNDFASSLPAIMISFGIIYLIYYVLKKKPPFFLLIALAFYCFNLWTISYSDKLMADIYVAFFSFLSIVIYYRFRYVKQGGSPIGHAIVFSAVLFLGFISKETIIMLFPLFFYVFVSDVISKLRIRFWVAQIISIIFFLVIYSIIIKLLAGSALARFRAIELNSYLNPCSYDLLPVAYLLKRISYEFIFYFTKTSMITGVIFVVPLFFNKQIGDNLKMKNSDTFFFVSSVLLFLSCNFMTISYKSYVPLCLDPRHYLFLIPVLSIAASEGMHQFIYEKRNWIIFVCVALALAAIAYFNDFNSAYRKYIPLLVIMVSWIFIRSEKKWIRHSYIFLLIIVIGFEAFILFRNLGESDYTRQRVIVYKQIINKKEKAVIITNKVQKYFGEYYLGFDSSQVKFITYNTVSQREIDTSSTIYILNNWYTNLLAGNMEEALPLFANGRINNYETVIDENGIELYKLKSHQIYRLKK